MKTLLKYPGSKWNIARWILNYFPQHKVYVEPFFGSGAVFFTKTPSFIEVINDINSDVVNLFRVCRERPAELARVLELTPYSREEYDNCRKVESDLDDLEKARRTVVLFNQTYGASNNCNKSWKNSRTSNSPRNPELWRDLPQVVYEVCNRLKSAHIENRNAMELVQTYNSSETLLYLDPPYLLDLRRHGLYKNEMSDMQHQELIELIKASKSQIILSAYDNELYNSELKDWNTAVRNTTAQFGLQRTEKIYFNFDIGLFKLAVDA